MFWSFIEHIALLEILDIVHLFEFLRVNQAIKTMYEQLAQKGGGCGVISSPRFQNVSSPWRDFLHLPFQILYCQILTC